MTPWYDTLEGLLAGLWQELGQGVRDQAAPMRRVVLASHGTGGGPEARIVALRLADRAAATVAVHTDTHSVKYGELSADPRVSLLAWDPDQQLQIRLKGTMTLATGASVASDWARVPEGSRGSYGVRPAPGTVIDGSDAYDRLPDPARFAVLTCRLAEIDAVLLTEDHHRRARYKRADGWRGAWLAP